LTYTDGDICRHTNSTRKVIITFNCDSKKGKGNPVFLLEDDNCNYVFAWATSHACPVALNPWIVFLIVYLFFFFFNSLSNLLIWFVFLFNSMLVFLVLYCVLSFLYRRKVLRKEGLQALPLYDRTSKCCSSIKSLRVIFFPPFFLFFLQ